MKPSFYTVIVIAFVAFGAVASVFSIASSQVPPVTVSPASLSFGNQFIGISSVPQTVTLTNNQSVALDITSSVGPAMPILWSAAICSIFALRSICIFEFILVYHVRDLSGRGSQFAVKSGSRRPFGCDQYRDLLPVSHAYIRQSHRNTYPVAWTAVVFESGL